MEDPWGNNAWSATDSGKNGDGSKGVLDPPKWNTFERDEDENTIDVGVPSWSAASGSGWGQGTNLWHAESSTLDAWKPSLSSDDTSEEQALEQRVNVEQRVSAKEQSEEGDEPPEVRPTLPTPPLSPLPVPSVTPPAVETPLSSPPRPLINPPSPDYFGSFESAEVVRENSHNVSPWIPQMPHFTSEGTDETWGGTWDGKSTADKEDKEGQGEDEWELAKEARRKRDRKVPPELLDSLVKQWDMFATDLYPKPGSERSESHSWRKGLDSIDGLTELVESFIPATSFPPPMPFNKTAVAQSVKETLRLTRSFAMSQTSPMAHLYATKGSTEWERSVKSQKAAANDEWGWDLKLEPEEKPDPADSSKDKTGRGLLSFWSRKTSSILSTPASDAPVLNPPKSPTVMSKPTSPATSAGPSVESSRIASPTTATLPNLSPPTADGDTVLGDTSSIQPSAVSRFFNRFSRKAPAVATGSPGKEKPTSLSLSSDDLSFLSDMTPSISEGSWQSQQESVSVNSLGGMLSWPTKDASANSTSSKLPPPIAPPPSSRPARHRPTSSQGSVNSFDAAMADAQVMDLLDKVMGGGPSSRSGYAPVTIDSMDLLDSPVESRAPLSALQSPEFAMKPISSQSSVQPPGISLISTPRSRTPVLSPSLPPPLTSSNARDSPALTYVSLPPIPPPHTPDGTSKKQPIALARFHNPLPPTPKRDLDDFANLLPASPSSGRSTPPQSPLSSQPGSSSSTKMFSTTPSLSEVANQFNTLPTLNMDDSVDFGDFGEFISPPIRTPSPPKVPQKTFKDHKPTLELVEKAASRQGRWPAPPSPSPQPLAPPPGPSSDLGYFNKSTRQSSQPDLLTNHNSPSKRTSISGTLVIPGQAAGFPQPLFADTPSPPASTILDMSPVALPLTQTSAPSLPPNPGLSKPTGASGLSAQDLSFFESL
ncbi:hypothetical protein JB92DRAFT_2885714 [Gautieria morchelliformis]|nr:hypothetical protein JB92DRAFT_2885714 [Gautieria morchelliformis]